MYRTCTTLLLFAVASTANASTVFVNELHYDNVGGDLGEFVEVAVTAGATNLSDITLTLYNGGNSSVYDSQTLDLFVGGATNVVIGGSNFDLYTWSLPTNGLQNGAPDGWALDILGTVQEFLSYEGTLTAADGPAAGLTSVDIGVAEASAPIGTSIQLIGGQFQTGIDTTLGQPNPVPEPSSHGLAFLTFIGMLAIRRRR